MTGINNSGTMDSNTKIDDLSIKAKLRKELADEYGISARTFNRWIQKAHLDIPHGLIDPYHLKIIYKKFGTPQNRKLS